jgi:hypothetical protein
MIGVPKSHFVMRLCRTNRKTTMNSKSKARYSAHFDEPDDDAD